MSIFNLDKLIEAVSPDILLTTNPFEKEITLYHGSSYQDVTPVIKPEGVCAGNRFVKPHMASYWAPTFDYAEIFALYRLIDKTLDDIKYVQFAPDNYHIMFHKDDYEYILSALRDKVIYVYTKTISKELITGGHAQYIDEYTIDVPVRADSYRKLKYNDYIKLLKDVLTPTEYTEQEVYDMYLKEANKIDLKRGIGKMIVYYNADHVLKLVRKYKKLQK